MWAGALLGSLVGLVLGCMGAGGGALAVPVLVALLGWPAHQAVSTSLLAVGMASAAAFTGMAARRPARPGELGLLLLLAGPGILGASCALRLGAFVPVSALLGLQGLLALWLAWRAWWPRQAPAASLIKTGVRPMAPWPGLAAIGLVCGSVGGLLGIGGGFLLVPALQRWGGRADPHDAMTLSLRVIALTSLTSWAVALPQSLQLPEGGAAFVAATLLGLLIGRRWSARWSARALQRAFTALLLGVTVAACVSPTRGSGAASVLQPHVIKGRLS